MDSSVLMTSSEAAQSNHLIHEKSPYLLQHAHNPVDWYPWGPEAFEKARREDKPILLSIGYSTCHWCHVMERESYEDPQVAELMNKYLVSIKVDREERPDVDKIYMTAVSAMTGSGGWPLNVFLTPDLKPFYGGTYFPPDAKWGHPGWSDVVRQIGSSWQTAAERPKILESGQHITDALAQYAQVSSAPIEGRPEWLEAAFKAYQASYDSARGGFGPAPKFPMPVNHFFLLRYAARSKNPEAREMSFHTLREMAKGGIYDHLGGGFARYSTDAHWHIPHFEKMLYDNAQLAVNYLEAYQISHEAEFQRVARETLDYVRRDMTSKQGGFYSAEDADSIPHPYPLPSRERAKGEGWSESREGAFYVWEKKEVIALLGDKTGEIFCFRYGIRDNGNAAQDPHGEFVNKNILYEAHPIPETAKHFQLKEEEATQILQQAKQILFEARKKRPRPDLDDKILSGWNGLMISAFAKAYQVWGDEKDLGTATKAAGFLRTHLYDSKTKQLYRRWRDGQHQGSGVAEDYAFMVQGLLDLYEAGFDPAWLGWAEELTDMMQRRFYDTEKGGFFMTAADQDPNLLVRFKEDQDNVEPSANSVAALNLLRLAQFTDRQDYRDTAQKTLQTFGHTLKESPRAMPYMLGALDYALSDPRQIVIAGPKNAPETLALFKVLHSHYIPVKVVMLAEAGPSQTALSKRLSFIEEMKPLNGKATGYVCFQYTCKKPTNDPDIFEKQLAF